MTVEELVTKTKMMLSGIQEQMKTAEITGTPPEDIPGAEHDKPIPEGATEPDPEVADGSMGPDSAYNEGGKPQENEPVGQLFEADEPVLNPEEKPEITADANAKTAGADALANSILEDIKRAQATLRSSVKKAEIVADKDSEEVTKKPEETADANADAEDTDKGGDKETVTPDTTVGDTPPEKDDDVNSDKQASDELQLTTDLLAKLACYMLAEEEGAELGERVLAKLAGQQAAKDTMDFLEKKAAEAEYWSDFEKGAQAAEALMDQAAEEQGAADAEALINQAVSEDAAASDAAGAADAEALINQAAEEQGAADADALMSTDSETDSAEGDGVTPEEFIEALGTMVSSGEITEDQAIEALEATGLADEMSGEAADDDLEIAEIASDIQNALESGAMTMDQAEALVQELSGAADASTIDQLKEDVSDSAAEPEPESEPVAEDAASNEAPEAPAAVEEKAAAANDIIRLVKKIRALSKR